MGDLAALPELNLAALLPGGPGWMDVQRCLRHDPEGAFRLLYYGLALQGLEALPAPEQLVAPHPIRMMDASATKELEALAYGVVINELTWRDNLVCGGFPRAGAHCQRTSDVAPTAARSLSMYILCTTGDDGTGSSASRHFPQAKLACAP